MTFAFIAWSKYTRVLVCLHKLRLYLYEHEVGLFLMIKFLTAFIILSIKRQAILPRLTLIFLSKSLKQIK